MKKQKLLLFLEFCTIFIFMPLVFVFHLLPSIFMMPSLLTIFIYVFVVLKRNGVVIFKPDLEKKELQGLGIRFFITTLLMFLFVFFYKPQNLFYFIKNAPLLWLCVILLYPIISAFTQEVIFRKFFFFRYPVLWKKNESTTVLLSALLFSYMHIVFQNFIAVTFTLIGGFVFSYMYKKTKSLWLVSLEHALYGDMLFTLGLGYYFYHGSVK